MRGWQFVGLLLFGSLFALTGLRQFFVEPLEGSLSNVVWFVIQVLPILLVLPGMLRNHVRSWFFAILAALLYFIHGVMLAATPDLRGLGIAECSIALAAIAVATFVLRKLREAAGE